MRTELERALRQEWWAPVAGLLAAFWFVIPALFLLGGQRSFGDRLTVLGAWVSALALVVGLRQRQGARRRGNVLILAGSAWSFLFYWMWLPYITAVVVSVGVLRSGFATHRQPHEECWRR